MAPTLWNELREHYEVEEFIASKSPTKIGIGLLRVPPGGFQWPMKPQDAEKSASSEDSNVAKVASSE